MKSLFFILPVFFLTVFTMNSQVVSTGDRFTVKISGTSSMHDWTSDVTQVKGTAVLIIEEETFAGIEKLNITIPVKSIESPKGSIMDRKTYDALKADKYPNIQFQLVEVVSLENVKTGFVIEAKGKLTIAGISKMVFIHTDAQMQGTGIRFTGNYKMKMSDFGIDPPTAMLGAMKTGDEITIHFDVNYK